MSSPSPQFVQDILEAGGCVDISGVHSSYAPALVAQWAQIAAAKGGHLTVGTGYDHDLYQQWATVGGKHFTVRL